VYLDYNGREFIEQSDTKNIGCYSVIIPAMTGKVNSDWTGSNSSERKIELKEDKGIRINFLGDLNAMLPSDMAIVKECVDASLQLCSAYGCMAEVTGMILDGVFYLYCSWRNQEITTSSAEQLLLEVMNQLQNSRKQLICLNAEDEAAVFDEMF